VLSAYPVLDQDQSAHRTRSRWPWPPGANRHYVCTQSGAAITKPHATAGWGAPSQ
jgi:hypothetical protein